MKKFEQLQGWEDSDFEDYPKSKPLVKERVIAAALVCIVVVLSVVGVVVWVNGRV